MEQTSYYISITAFVLVIICWFIFAGTFLLRKKTASAPDKTSAPRSLLGIVLQGLSFGLVWALHRTPLFSPFIDSQYVLNIVFQVLAVVLAAGSVWMANSAIRELGKQWSLQARLIEGHKLVTGGVYQIVRHPIYTAMLGKLLATGIIISHWLVVLIAVAIFIIGTLIRTRSEEKLLRDAFGKEYEEWAARVPGFVPFVKM
jgi:protein-S-isoprenylcysteine O-methyltransferase Ste14